MAKIILRAGKVAIKIIMLFAIFGLIACFVKVIIPAQAEVVPVGDVSAQLEQAETYVAQDQYDQATAIYNSIIADSQVNIQGQVFARGGLIVVSIHRVEITAAEAALESLKTNYPNEVAVSSAVFDAAHAFSPTRPDKAITLFQQILDTWPNCEDAIRAQVSLVRENLALNNELGAESAYQELLTKFSGHPDMSDAVFTIADAYVDSNPQKSLELYQEVVEKWPNSQEAMQAQVGVVRINIELKNEPAAQSAFQKLITQYSAHEKLPEVVYMLVEVYYVYSNPQKTVELCEHAMITWPDYSLTNESRMILAKAYLDLNAPKPQEALEQFQHILVEQPGTEAAMWARAGIIRANIALGDDTNTQEGLDEFVAEFANSPDVPPEALCLIGEEYGFKASELKSQGLETKAEEYFQKAVSVWERVIHEFPVREFLPWAYYCSAKCYGLELAEYEKAIEYYQKLLCDWPGYHCAARAQFSIGKCYESLKDTGTLTGSEADLKIEQAYKAVLENYPDSTSAKDACLKLGWLNFNKGLWPESVHYWELSRETLGISPKDYKALNILYPLGRAYEELGRFDLAVKAYSEFIIVAPSIDPRVDKVKARLEQLALDMG